PRARRAFAHTARAGGPAAPERRSGGAARQLERGRRLGDQFRGGRGTRLFTPGPVAPRAAQAARGPMGIARYARPPWAAVGRCTYAARAIRRAGGEARSALLADHPWQ